MRTERIPRLDNEAMNDDASDSPQPRKSGATGTNGGIIGWAKRKLKPRNGADTLRETIEELIEQEDTDELPETDELVMFRNILQLRNMAARDIMVPRADIAAIDIDTPASRIDRIDEYHGSFTPAGLQTESG